MKKTVLFCLFLLYSTLIFSQKNAKKYCFEIPELEAFNMFENKVDWDTIRFEDWEIELYSESSKKFRGYKSYMSVMTVNMLRLYHPQCALLADNESYKKLVQLYSHMSSLKLDTSLANRKATIDIVIADFIKSCNNDSLFVIRCLWPTARDSIKFFTRQHLIIGFPCYSRRGAIFISKGAKRCCCF